LTIKEELRAKIVSMHAQGIGRNRIAFETGVSSASVTNIIRKIKIKKKEIATSIVNGISTTQEEMLREVDFSDMPYPENFPNSNIGPIVNVNSIVEAQEDVEKEEGRKNNQPKQSFSNVANPPNIIDIGMDWDDPELYQRRLFKEIMNDKRERREELQRIEQVADLLPLARELKNSGITVEMLLSYISLVNEEAAVENIDIRTAAINLARDLEDYKQTISDMKAEGIGLSDLTKLAHRKLDDDYASNLIWGANN
jgi:hypothetical protein